MEDATPSPCCVFNVLGFLVVYGLQRLQHLLPLNPQGLAAVTPDSSFNTAVSFATNTNWQGYGGEATMSYLTQMLGLTVQNFVSAATGMAVLVALIRGFARRNGRNDRQLLGRSDALDALHPAAAVADSGPGAGLARGRAELRARMQTVALRRSDDRRRRQAGHGADDLPWGPAASQIAIKQLGTNGGGFFNVNSAHPLENPTPLSNFLEVLSILLIPAALCYTFGVHGRRHAARLGHAGGDVRDLRAARAGAATRCEQAGNPRLAELGVDQAAGALQVGGNMEGKETRFGIANSALWASATTAASNGSVNSMHDSYTPLGGLVPMWLMQLGEVIFGGVGSGLYGMLMFAIVAVFVAGLMVGRTPEYLGKKIEAYEMKMASLVILIPPAGRAGRHGDRRVGRRPRREGEASCNSGCSRLLRNPLRLLVGRQQQRQRLRRA